MIRNFFSFVFELIKIIVIALAIVIPVRYFLVQPFYVKGASMEPTFYDSEYLIIDELSYRLRAPERGEVVVFRYPRDPSEFFIKRVIGLPGETLEIIDGGVIIYNEANPEGKTLEEDYLPSDLKTYGFSDNEKVTLKEGEYYVMGDNRGSSKDSRTFGPVDESFIVGRVIFRGWPFDRIDLFNELPEYSVGN